MNLPDRSRIYSALWIVLAITLPWPVAFNSIAIGLLFCGWLAMGDAAARWNRLIQQPWCIPFFAYFTFYLVAEFSTGFATISHQLPFLVLPLMLASGPALSAQTLRRLGDGFVLSVAFMLALAIVRTIWFPSDVPNFDYPTRSAFHGLYPDTEGLWSRISYIGLASSVDLHPSYFSLYLTFSSVWLLDSFKTEGVIRWKVGILIFMMVGVMLLSSRIGLLSYTVFVAIWMYRLAVRRSVLMAMSTTVLFILVVGLLAWSNHLTRFRFKDEPGLPSASRVMNSIDSRLLSWSASWSAIRQEWVRGYGVEGAQVQLNKTYQRQAPDWLPPYPNAHNQFLQTWLEVGVGGIVALLFMMGIPLVFRPLTALQISLAGLIILFCVAESVLTRQKGIVFFCLFQPLLLSYQKQSS